MAMKIVVSRYLSILLVGGTLLFTACSGGSENKTDETAQMQNTEEAAETNNMAAANSAESTLSESNKTVDGKLNVNTATDEAFRTIPEVGDKMVYEFKEYRPYVSIQQFRREIGKYVNEDQVAEYEKYIYVPIHRNDSDLATLLQIPGLDEEEGTALIGMRPFETDQEFLDALSGFIDSDEMIIAEGYLDAE